jgi:hypothetical protein
MERGVKEGYVGYSYDPLFVLVTDGLEPFAAAIRYDAYVALFLRGWKWCTRRGAIVQSYEIWSAINFSPGRFLSRNQVSGRSMRGRVD